MYLPPRFLSSVPGGQTISGKSPVTAGITLGGAKGAVGPIGLEPRRGGLANLSGGDVKIDQRLDALSQFWRQIDELNADSEDEGNAFRMPDIPDSIAPQPKGFLVVWDFYLQDAFL